MPVIKKAFDIKGDETFEFSTENDALKNKTGSYDEKCLEESETKLLRQIDDEKRANYNVKTAEKTLNKWHVSSIKLWRSEFDNFVSKN